MARVAVGAGSPTAQSVAVKSRPPVSPSGPGSCPTGVKYALLIGTVFLAACGDANKTATTKTLETGAAVMQKHSAVNALDIYLVGFHPMKADPSYQMEAHHFCRQRNEDVAQCVLFDGNGADAKMNGIEYIISAAVYDRLAETEKQYWHPHNYEILSGQLVAPGVPDVAEKELMRRKMNSYGKTYHIMWGNEEVPPGDPKLAWSFTADGQLRPEMLQSRDQRLGINTTEKRNQRQDLSALANR